MNNKDLPAYPTSPNSNDPNWAAAHTGGLTKRELFAMSALQGVISNAALLNEAGRVNNEADALILAASMAIRAADETLKQLDE